MATSYRDQLGSPPKYRRSNMDIYQSLETGQHTPTTSALDRKWVHRSVGDLTLDSDLQLTNPRLTSKFNQELYQKYPRAFQRRREARDAGRKLFNPKPHVKFEDEIVDDMSLKSYRSERPMTNWDREVGHYKNSRSRECFTSLEPSESGSVLSVKERLHLNSRTLNRLLNENSPLRRRFAKESNQATSPTDGNSVRDALLSNRTRLRFRHRKVLQRKVDNKQNGAVNGHLGELRKPPSLSAQYTRRAKTVSPTNPKHKHVDVEALLANADLEINTLLESFGTKTSGPESPPDSAIDVDTPSIRSLATTEKGSNSDLPLSIPQEYSLHDIDNNAGTTGNCNGADHLYVDTGGSKSKTEGDTNEEILDPLKDPDNILLLKEYDINFDDIQIPKDSEFQRLSTDNEVGSAMQSKIDKIAVKDDIITKTSSDIVHSVVQSNEAGVESEDGQGMMQSNDTKACYGEKADELLSNIVNTDISNDNKYSSNKDLHNGAGITNGSLEANGDKSLSDRLNPTMEFGTDASDMKQFLADNLVELDHDINALSKRLNPAVEYGTDMNDVKQAQADIAFSKRFSSALEYNGTDGSDMKQVLADTLAELNHDKNYQADDEGEESEAVGPRVNVATVGSARNIPLHRDSDVDSGIGQSGTETRSPLPIPPPRGRSRQRGAASKTQPIRADHSLLPLRSEVDTCILNEVDLTKLSHGLSCDHRRQGNHVDMVDDTDPSRESVTVLSSEQKLTEKYRRKRSPSPYVLKSTRAVSPRSRPQSAPIYYSGKLDLHVVDISLSNGSLSDISSDVPVSSTLNSVSVSGIDSFNVSSFPPHSVHDEMSCQNSTQSSSKSNSGKHLQQFNNGFTSNLNNGQFETDNLDKSSSPHKQRNSSTSSYSVTSVSSVDTVTTMNYVHITDGIEGYLKDEVERSKDDTDNIDRRHTDVKHVSLSNNLKDDEMDTECSPEDLASYYPTTMLPVSKQENNKESNDVISEYNSKKQIDRKENTFQEEIPYTETHSYNQTVNQNIADNQEIVEQHPMPNEHIVARNKYQIDTITSSVNHTGNKYHDELKLHSAKKIDIVKPKFETQSSVDSKDSLETVELSSDPELMGSHGSQTKEIRRIYKPSVNSPRVNEKKTNVRNIFKHKKGRFSPGIEQHLHKDNQEIVLVSCDKVTPEKMDLEDSSKRCLSNSLHTSGTGSIESNKHNGTVRIEESAEMLMGDTSHPTYSARPVIIDPECRTYAQNGPTSHEKHMSKLKTNLRAELNLSKYKISSDRKSGSDQTNEIRLDHLSQSSGSHWSQDSQRSQDSSKSQGSQESNGNYIGEQTAKSGSGAEMNDGRKQRSKSDDSEIHVEESNLQQTKGLSVSKGSLMDKMGGLKLATKGKFKAMRKAMSLERGIDQAGNQDQGQGHSKPDSKGGHYFFPKMKKAPSLKSITGLFGRKKKKGKYSAEDVEASSSVDSGSNLSVGSTNSLSIDKRKQWASCHTLSSIEMSPDTSGVGRLVKMNPDGTQIVELRRPANGHLGFFIAQGNPKYKKGVFVSRFSKEGPDNMLAGLLGVGDEILEVNRHLVHDLSLDAVYKLMGASQTITLKIFPLIARKDI